MFKVYESKIYTNFTYAFISFVYHQETHNLRNFQVSVNLKKQKDEI